MNDNKDSQLLDAITKLLNQWAQDTLLGTMPSSNPISLKDVAILFRMQQELTRSPNIFNDHIPLINNSEEWKTFLLDNGL